MTQPQAAGDAPRTRPARTRPRDAAAPLQPRGPSTNAGLPGGAARSLGIIGERIYRLLATPGVGEPVPGTATTRDQLRLLRHWLERQTTQQDDTHRGRLAGQVLRFLAVPDEHPLAVCGLHIGRVRLLTSVLAEHADTEADPADTQLQPPA